MFNCGVELVHTYNLPCSKSHHAVQCYDVTVERQLTETFCTKSIVLCVLVVLGPKVDGQGSTSAAL